MSPAAEEAAVCSRLSPVEQEQEQERQNSAQHSPVPFNEAADTAARQQNFAQGKRSFQAEEEEEEEHSSPLSPAEEEEEGHSPLSPAEEEEEHDGRGF